MSWVSAVSLVEVRGLHSLADWKSVVVGDLWCDWKAWNATGFRDVWNLCSSVMVGWNSKVGFQDFRLLVELGILRASDVGKCGYAPSLKHICLWFSMFFFSWHTDLCGLILFGLHLLWCHFQLPGDCSGFCGSVFRATVCSNELSVLFLYFPTAVLQTPVAYELTFHGTPMCLWTVVENGNDSVLSSSDPLWFGGKSSSRLTICCI